MPEYVMYFQEGYQLRSDTEPYYFSVTDNQDAIVNVARFFDLTGDLTEEAFLAHGGESLNRIEGGKEIQVFPPLPEKINVAAQSPHWDDKTRDDWVEFMKWIKARGGEWQEGIGGYLISFYPVSDVKIDLEEQQVGDPEITIYKVTISDGSGTWEETFCSKELTRAFLRGVQAAFPFAGAGFITTPPVP